MAKYPDSETKNKVTEPLQSRKGLPTVRYEQMTEPASQADMVVPEVPTTNSLEEANAPNATSHAAMWPPQGVRDLRTPANQGLDPTPEMPGA